MIVGSYVKKRIPEYTIGPYGADTLMLFDDNHCEIHNGYFRKEGTYEISYSIDGTYINFTYLENKTHNGEPGLVSYGRYVKRQWFSRIRISWDSDLNTYSYYEKID
jgi:hypothetical protein